MIPAPPDWDANYNQRGNRPWNPHMPPAPGHPIEAGQVAVRVSRYPTVALEMVVVEKWWATYQRDWSNRTDLRYQVRRPDGTTMELHDESIIVPGSPEWEKVKVRSGKALVKYQERFGRFETAELMARTGQVVDLEPPKPPKKTKTRGAVV